MEKQKLLKLITKIYKPNFSKMSPTDVYTHFVSQFPYNEYARVMSATDIVMASFLLPFVDTPDVLETKYDEIIYNLFGYTLIEIDSDYSEVECTECSGNGYDSCNHCGGDGEEECSSCGGDGQDDEGDTCDECSGDGKIHCDYCEGDGTINCSECGGSGNWDDYDRREISQWFFASYNTSLLEEYSDLDEWDEVSPNAMLDNKSISLSRVQGSIEEPYDIKLEVNDTYFHEVTDEPKFGKMLNNRVGIDNIFGIV